MSMKSIIMTTTGAAAGMLIGNYLYDTDKKANAEKETPVPFYTVRKVAEDISKKAEETYNDIKTKINKRKEDKSEEVVEETEEVVSETTEEVVEAEVVETSNEDNKNIDESKVIDVEVVNDKAVPVDQKIEQEDKTDESKNDTSNVEPIIPSTEETTIPKFTITDAPAAPAETQTPVNNETVVPLKRPSNNKKSTTKKAEQ